LRRGLLVNLALSLGVTLVLLALLEGGARVVEKRRPDRPQIAEYIWNWDDKMPGGFYVVNTDAVGWPPWELYNGDGLRDRTRTREKPAGFTRIAFLGDSVTLGAEITPAEAYPQRLEARYASEGRRAEVMSVALWGWSTRQERIAWQRIARHYRPDQAVLAICLNDIPELQNNLSRPPRWLMELHERSALVRLLVNAEGREIDSVERLFSDPGAPTVEEALQRFFAETRTLRREVEAEGSSFALVVFPFRFQILNGAPAPSVQQRLAAFCRDERLRCLDLLKTLTSAGTGAFIDYDHLSPFGAQLVADTLYRSGLLTQAVSDPLTLRRALAARLSPGAQAAALWLDARQSAPTRAAMTAIAAVLEHGEPSERQAAAWALGVAGHAAEPFVEAVALRLRRDEAPGVRAAAARALVNNTQMSAREIASEAMRIAGEICIYSNSNIIVEEL
jgi:lysophospholipase L1-like esterase